MSDEMIDVLSPIDGLLIKSYSVTTEHAIAESLTKARAAANSWADKTIAERLGYLSALKQTIVADIDSITETIVSTTGKVKTEVVLGEIYPLLEMLRYYEKNSAKILSPQKISTSPLAFPNTEAGYIYQPFGVVAVISPWNFPFQLTLYPLLSALIAGNAVVFKSSELSQPVADLVMQLLAKINLPDYLVQNIIGGGETAQLLIKHRPDLVFFTGSLAAGRAIMANAAQHPIPVILELGGKDAMVVFADAEINRVLNATLYGAFSNSGQVCVSVERLYVEAELFDSFIQQLCLAVSRLKVGHGDEGDLGAISSQSQIDTIKAHYQDAIAKGAKASAPLTIDQSYVYPVVLWDITADMLIMQQETFGPLLPVIPFSNLTDLIHQINADEHGLNASIWSKDTGKAENLATQLQVGNWAVNDVIKNIGHPQLPFGGVKNSGFGRYHGDEGLRSFCYTVSHLVSYSHFVKEPNWFPYSQQSYTAMRAYIDTLYARDSLWQKLKRNWRELRYFQQYSGLNLAQHGRNFLIFISRK